MGVSSYKMVETNSIYYKEEHILLRKMVRDFSNEELKPLAQDIDKNSTFPEESIKKIADSDYKYGFVTDIKEVRVPPGLIKNIIKLRYFLTLWIRQDQHDYVRRIRERELENIIEHFSQNLKYVQKNFHHYLQA